MYRVSIFILYFMYVTVEHEDELEYEYELENFRSYFEKLIIIEHSLNFETCISILQGTYSHIWRASHSI